MLYASVLRRMGATVIDLLLVCCISLPLWIWFLLSLRNIPPASFFETSLGLFVIWYLISLFYFIGYWTWCGQTPGQIATGIKVTRTDGRKTSIWISILRYLIGYSIYYVLFFPFVLPALAVMTIMFFNKKKRGLHDFISGTCVVQI